MKKTSANGKWLISIENQAIICKKKLFSPFSAEPQVKEAS